jgi:NO-binding membrane sensor protein with MHYT domain
VHFFTPHDDALRVATSVLIAAFASFVTLDLAKRVRGDDHSVARIWWAGGSRPMPAPQLARWARQHEHLAMEVAEA